MNSKLRPSSTKNSQNRKAIVFHARKRSAATTSPTRKRFSPYFCCFPGGCFCLFLGRTRHTCGRENYVPVTAHTSLGTKKGKNGLKGSEFLFICITFCFCFEVRTLGVCPLLYFQVVCICCRNAYARLLDNIILSDRPSP